VQEGGNALRAERVVYLLEQERTEAIPPPGQQVFSQMVIQSGRLTPTPLTP
jgi:lipopolysaccharide export system protein LptA